MVRLILALFLNILMVGCSVEVEDPGSLPDIDVTNGELPEIDIDPADVRITTDTQVVRVPQIEVTPDTATAP
jgi:hypothetical protein